VHSYTWYYVAVSGQLHAPAALSSGKDPIPVRAFCLEGEDISTTCRWKCLNGSSDRRREFFPKSLISSSFSCFLFIFLSFFPLSFTYFGRNVIFAFLFGLILF
jgi:hypothetical protein